MKAPHTTGTVTLVGAGPGDPDLLTLKAVKAIAAATVLLVDDLVNEDVLQHAQPGARIVAMSSLGAQRAMPSRSMLSTSAARSCSKQPKRRYWIFFGPAAW